MRLIFTSCDDIFLTSRHNELTQVDIIIWQVKAEIPYLVKASVNIYIQGKNKKKIPLVNDNNIAKIQTDVKFCQFILNFMDYINYFLFYYKDFKKLYYIRNKIRYRKQYVDG